MKAVFPTLTMKFVILSTLLAVVLATGVDTDLSNREIVVKFVQYAEKHGRNISNPREHDKRLALYSSRKSMIDQHNEEFAQGLHTYTMAENQFTDRTEEELKFLTGAIAPSGTRSLPTTEDTDVRALPASVDLRNRKCMPPVKNQKGCGSCWAFAAVTPLEFQNCRKQGSLTVLSEQQLVSCSKEACDGGFYTTAWGYLKSAGGIMSSDSFPYKATKTSCGFTASQAVAKIASYDWTQPMNSESGIQAAVAKRGPIPVAIYANGKFMAYRSGIFNDPGCPTNSVNHAVVVVGYGTNSTAGGDYWIIRNSWGASWGSNGYILMKRGVKMCGISLGAYVVIA